MGPYDSMGDQETPYIPLGVTQGTYYPLRIPETHLLGTWGHHWVPAFLSSSSLLAVFCWLETQEQPGQQESKVRDI